MGGVAHRRARIIEARFGRRGERRIAGIADGVENVADEAIAADALDGTGAEQGAKRGVIEGGETG